MNALRHLLVGLALLIAPPLQADGPDEPDTELRILRPAGQPGTSACIGDPRTPTCAVETYEACLLRADPALCRAVGRDHAIDRASGVEPPPRTAIFFYRLFGQRIVYADDIPAGRGEGPHAWREADIALLTEWHGCGPKEKSLTAAGAASKSATACPPAQCSILRPAGRVSGEKTVVVRRSGDRWIVVDATYDQVLPDAIWGR